MQYNKIMTDDGLLLKSLEDIKGQMAAERADIRRTDGLNGRIAAEYDCAMERLGRILPEIKGVMDVFYLEDEEDFVFLVELLENYSENFIIDGRDEEKKKRGEAEFAQLQNIISEFYEDDEEEDDEEEDDDDENGGNSGS